MQRGAHKFLVHATTCSDKKNTSVSLQLEISLTKISQHFKEHEGVVDDCDLVGSKALQFLEHGLVVPYFVDLKVMTHKHKIFFLR
jgi:hypothetical protein